ncbi:glycosyl transferase [Hesseltinella vesiculosa]|uniref:UDP-N-acetylglucosamine transferase subunit ALG13 n=1 Tax=Hesseltinella vesiculosa TaxID=101127 RepID=A0A1X2G8P3_9FUNG|nr:glycosyl transferase [Hesseltinella vesiculosa]
MRLFVTVGSTGFDDLIKSISRAEFLQQLSCSGYTHVTVQYGSSKSCYRPEMPHTLSIQGYDYTPNIEQDMKDADVIVCHSGAGTLIQGLRLGKPLVVTVNNALLNNHQLELAQALAEHQYIILTDQRQLGTVLQDIPTLPLQTFPPANPSLFTYVLDKQMGISS